MKKHILTIGKAMAFIVAWVLTVLISTLPALDQFSFLSNNAAFQRLWWEALPLLGVILVTGVFVCLIDKNQIKVSLLRNPLKNTLLGFVLGCMWLGAAVLTLSLVGSFQLGNKNQVSYLFIWFLAVLLNVIMQEYLVRGYLFSLFKEKYNIVVSVIITTIFFTAMHGGAFEAGIVAVLNVITMSIFVSLLLIYTESLLAPIIVHFIWNGVGCLVFGGVSLAEDYPSIWDCVLTGNNLLSGGSAKIEGSIVVLIVNTALIAFMAFLLGKRRK